MQDRQANVRNKESVPRSGEHAQDEYEQDLEGDGRMDVFDAIKRRRSIRKFQDKPIPRGLIEEVLVAATLAPSGKNLQPWRFIVLEGDAKQHVVETMLARAEALKAAGVNIGSAIHSARIMAQAPAVVLVYDALIKPADDHNGMARLWSLVNTQSIGAAIQNMLLAAEAVGLGTLWICDIFVAEEEISSWLGRTDELVAAVAIGYPDEAPPPRPRKPWQEVTEWRLSLG